MVIDLSAEHAPITVKHRPCGGVAITRGQSLILMDDAELAEFIRIAQASTTSAEVRQRCKLA